MDDPRPLIESDANDALTRLLRSAQALHVDYDLAGALARHEQLVAAGVRPLAPASGHALRGVWIGCAIAVVGVAAILAARSPDEERTPERSSVAVPLAAEPPAAAREPTAIAAPAIAPGSSAADDAVVAPARAPAKAREPAGSARRAVTPPRPRDEPASVSAADDDDRIAREAAHVRRIRELLDAGDAAAALRACDDGDRELGRGVFALEREGLRVLASLALERPSARATATAYLDAHPRAPLARRIRDALGRE
jgi:hypothetical protein